VSVEKLKGAKQRALDCVRNAIKVEAQSISRLRQLYNGTGADPKDDDLKVFNGDRAFDDLLGRKSSLRESGRFSPCSFYLYETFPARGCMANNGCLER
jgi:hypothetical protein